MLHAAGEQLRAVGHAVGVALLARPPLGHGLEAVLGVVALGAPPRRVLDPNRGEAVAAVLALPPARGGRHAPPVLRGRAALGAAPLRRVLAEPAVERLGKRGVVGGEQRSKGDNALFWGDCSNKHR